MEITLRNGENIFLDWNPIVLEYLEDYEGGIEQLRKDVGNKNCRFRTFNFIVYCVISAVYPRELSYTEAVSLVDINDFDKIVNFIIQNVNKMEQQSKKEVKSTMQNRRHHRK